MTNVGGWEADAHVGLCLKNVEISHDLSPTYIISDIIPFP
jgi:hypothetical protein